MTSNSASEDVAVDSGWLLDAALLDESTLSICPGCLDKRFWEAHGNNRSTYTMDIISIIAAILLHAMAAWQASMVLSGQELALCLIIRAIGMVHGLMHMLLAIRTGDRYHHYRQLANTLQRLRAAVFILLMYCSAERRTWFREGLIASHTGASKVLFSSLLQVPVLNILTTILHPVKFKLELLLQAFRVASFALLEAPVFAAAAAQPDIAWVSISACNGANRMLQYPGFPMINLLTCDPHRAARFTATLLFIILGAYAPGMSIYLLERGHKLRWLSKLWLRAGRAEQPATQHSMMPLWWTVPVHLYCITISTVIFSSLL